MVSRGSDKDSRIAAVNVFCRHGNAMRMTDALKAGVSRRMLYALRDSGELEQMSRGVYRLASAPALTHPDLVSVARRSPRAVICLLSALAIHDLTTQVPHEVYVAVARDAEPPRIEYPPVRVFRFGPRAFVEGIEVHDLEGEPVRIYSREKTLADCFKYRNVVGLETAIEALRRYRDRGRVEVQAILRAAAACRVANVMRPYLEAVL